MGKLSVTQYAKKRKITRQGVLDAIANNYKMPGISKVEKVGNTYVLTEEKEKKQLSCNTK